MTLHEAIQEVLRLNHNAWMTAAEIAEDIADRQLYLRGDGGRPLPSHVHARINQYLYLFAVNRCRSPMRFRLL